jgi:outer membrane protease
MKKMTSFVVLVFALSMLFAESSPAHAQKDSAAPGLREALGIIPDPYYANVDLAATPEGTAITAKVDDPSKLLSLGLQGVTMGDAIQLLNRGNGVWRVTHLATKNELTYYGLPVIGAKDFSPPDSGLIKLGGIDLAIGIGRVNGHTTYQIGGDVSTPAGRTEVHFPISQLKFPLDAYMASAEGSVGFANDWEVRGNVKKNVTDDVGKMEDSDWGVYWLEAGYPAEQDTLDIYSESDAELDALMFDVSVRYRLYKWFFIGLGYLYQKFDYDVSGLNQWYPSSAYYFGTDFPHDRVRGKVLTYEVTYNIPYLELAAIGMATDDLRLEISLGYSPMVQAEDEDHHLLRSKVNKGECDGHAIMLSMEAYYGLPKNWFATLGVDYARIEADGESKAYFDGIYDHTIDMELESEQVFYALSIGYAF